jgi:hypothetical protein
MPSLAAESQDKKDYILYAPDPTPSSETSKEQTINSTSSQEEAFNEETGEINWDW